MNAETVVIGLGFWGLLVGVAVYQNRRQRARWRANSQPLTPPQMGSSEWPGPAPGSMGYGSASAFNSPPPQPPVRPGPLDDRAVTAHEDRSRRRSPSRPGRTSRRGHLGAGSRRARLSPARNHRRRVDGPQRPDLGRPGDRGLVAPTSGWATAGLAPGLTAAARQGPSFSTNPLQPEALVGRAAPTRPSRGHWRA
jgi:hypothetical protein